jgi:hypothetical protein
MNRRTITRVAATLFVIVAGFGARLAAQPPAAEPSTATLLSEANRAFTYRGEPINPLAVKELLSWISDSLPGPVAVDLAGTWQSNRYYGQAQRRPDGSVHIDMKTTSPSPAAGADAGWFEYRRVGTLASGVHVLETWDNGGGSGVFTSLLFVKFVVDQEQTSGARRQRLVMMRLGEEPLGDRYGGAVRARGNTVEIGAGGRGGAKARALNLDWMK